MAAAMTLSGRQGRRGAFIALIAAVAAFGPVSPSRAGILDSIASLKTLIDLAIEARSAADIVKDNKIVLAVNRIMGQLGTIKASTEIYEQRLLITGLFDDKKLYDRFLREVKKVKNVKKMYWHVRYLGKAAQKKLKQAGKMIGWAKALVLDTKVGLALVAKRGVADVNYRVAADAFSQVYLIGRARSRGELKTALTAARGVKTARKIVNYVAVRP
jgi:osmotically-inducible protein OsmY